MADFHQQPIAYGVKLLFADGTVVNWYRDSRRKTVYAEKNPLGHTFPRSAGALEEITAVVDGRSVPPRMIDDQGLPIGGFDGGASPNPGPGGWGVVLPDGRELCGGEAHTTNNRMELTGAIRLLEETSGPLHVIGDSRYVITGIERWIHNWRRRGWLTAEKNPVENRDLWERLYELTQGRRITWERVSGHRGHPVNERCDQLSHQGRRRAGSRDGGRRE
jgi:ribonuclease HI